MLAVRARPSVIAGDVGDHLDLERLEPAKSSVLDQVVGMLVVSGLGDVVAHVVKERRELQKRALLGAEPVPAARAVEELEGQLRDLPAMRLVVEAALGE